MITRHIFGLLCSLFIILSGCRTSAKIENNRINISEFNFTFIGYDINKVNPEDDQRSFYKVFIDKIESGRTTTGLESQKKFYNTNLSPNRHLLHVEKWILDIKKEKYVKLNNIDQPKPNYIYFSIEEYKTAVLTMETDEKGKTVFKINYE